MKWLGQMSGDAFASTITYNDMSDTATLAQFLATGGASTAGAVNVGAIPEPTLDLLRRRHRGRHLWSEHAQRLCRSLQRAQVYRA